MANTAEELLLRIQGDSSSGQQAVQQLADTLSNALAKALSQVKQHTDDSNQATAALKKYLDDLTPSTKNAHAAFTDLKTTLTDLWEHPTQEIGKFAQALATDLAPALGAVGIVAGLTVGAIAAVGVASYELAEQTAKVGATIQDMSYKTGINVPALSTWRGAVEIAGGSLDQFSNAVFMMQRRMAEGGPQFTAGLDRIGLSMSDLKSLDPDQQFLKMADGIRALEDPAQRAAAAMELFGRPGRDLLPLIMKNLGELVDESKQLGSTWTEQDAKAAEDFEMQARGLNLQLENIKTTIGRELIPAFTTALHFAKGSIGWFILEAYTDIKIAQLALSTLVPSLDTGMFGTGGGTTPAAPKAPKGWGDPQSTDAFLKSVGALQDATIAASDLEVHLGKLSERVVPLTAQQQAWTAAMLAGGDNVKEIAVRLTALNGGVAVSEKAIKNFEVALTANKKYTEEWNVALGGLADVLASPDWNGTVESMLKLGGSTKDTAIYFGMTEAAVRKVEQELTTFGKIVKLEAGQPLEDFTAHLRRLGDAIPEKFFTDAAKINTELYQIEIGAKSSASALESIGTKAKPSLQDLDAQLTKSQRVVVSIAADLQQLPNLLIQAFTGGGGFGGAIQALETTLSASLFDPNKGVLKNITSKLSESVGGVVSGALGKTVGGLVGSIAGAALPVVGALIGPAIEALMNIGGPSKDELAARDTFGQFQKQFGSLQDTIAAVGAAYAKAGKTGVEAQQALQRALDATHVSAQAEKAALDEINGVLNAQKKDEADLQAAVQRYNFSISELGPAMQKQQLDQQAQQLLNDWRLLVDSGVAMTTVNEHMAGSMDSYLKLARQTGQEVPMAMQPILQKMIDQGLLTDAAGKKITSLSDLGVKFSMTMSDGFKLIADKLQTLLEKLGLVPKVMDAFKEAGTDAANAVADAMAKIPTNIETTITVNGAPGGGPVGGSSGGGGPEVGRDGLVALSPAAAKLSGATRLPPNDAAWWEWQASLSGAARGGLVTADGIQYLASGLEHVQRLARGTDTVPAMLTPGEAVLTRAATATLGPDAIRALNRGTFSAKDLAGRFGELADGGVHVGDININGSLIKDRQAIRDLAREIGDVFNNRVRQIRHVGLGRA